MLAPAAAEAESAVRIGDLVIESVWARASIGTARPAAAYLTIVNRGRTADRLVAVTSPAAKRAMMHRTVREGGIMRMRPAGTVPIPAGATVSFAPGGLHIMLMGLKAPLSKGGTVRLTLVFARAGRATVTARIAGPGATKPPQ